MRTISFIVFLLVIGNLRAGGQSFTDIPGDGVIPCGPNNNFQPVCPGGVGTVSISSGTLTGVLQQGGSTLGIGLGQTPEFLTFTTTPPNPNNPPNYNPQWVGPLGLNPEFQPNASHVGNVGLPANLPPSLAYLDATVPIAGQEITLDVTNDSGSNLNSVFFFLGRDTNSLSTVTARQNDGLTFGLYCTGQTHAEGTLNDCALPQNWQLLITPSGSGTLNPADLVSSGATFGDVLRFNGVDLAPGQTGQFAFFLTDYTSTRTPPGGFFTPANQSFVLEVAPQPVPEPSNALSIGIGLAAIGGSVWFATRVKLDGVAIQPARRFE